MQAYSAVLPRSNRCLEFQKSSQLFIRTDNETLSVVAMCVRNPDRDSERSGGLVRVTFRDDFAFQLSNNSAQSLVRPSISHCMSYVEKNLMPGEQIEDRANLHWLVFILPTLLFIAAIWLFSLGGNIAKFLALILIVGVLVTGLHAVIERMTSEFAVTNKRVLIKTGLIRRHSLETLLGKIESIGVAQSILGRILGFGTIVISGTGGSKEPFHRIANPMMFRRRVQEQIATMEERRDTRKDG